MIIPITNGENLSPDTKNYGIWQEPFLLLSNADGSFRLLLKHIIYCSSYNSSTEFHITNDRRIVVSKPIVYYEQLLAAFGFIRIHHNSLINLAYLCHTSKGEETSDLTLTTGKKLTMSRAKKREVMNTIKQWSIEAVLQKPNIPTGSANKPVDGKKVPKSDKSSSEPKK